ncbi:SAM-dependent chlorinase/fluorinase [Coleofasciculus sp. FACHB-64]|uniref:SAM hydrolase/SAM-dependent halogenase family protein n=1 Tax=Cyanophyceae TaxID=3028117 RepID=UPI001688C696|nr:MULTISPECIES: SAM-dependent chlorinase/fluorinase [unclassified Coleofasciculus]MBD1839040.1 SAM-dependent chlorinase/fluorinase [Coleofasciculus sp. FACHB-501]MBD1902919.1 SAM-dependent chlorinase/fluorinase [Coleofasciculus sp. FACHB-125]MBD2048711.1 SAM-dependent chlorinase/fluorinase [Coleofasciculus sp. FACHB-64]MBD2087731.1 SAM-dependent chlorinase/fluorinase [Coleofasciculus sp. FACHB-542]
MFISLIADYGTGDPAFAEVTQRLLMALPSSQIHCLSVPPFSTLATGFWIAQLGLNPGPEERLIYHNCAPRQDDPEARQNNEGEGLTYALLPNGVKVVGVFAGYTLSFIKDHAQVLQTVKVSRGGSQFRSRDVFPNAAAAIAQGDTSYLGEVLNPSQIPDAPSDRVAWIDGYGNIKTTIPADTLNLKPEEKVVIRVGDVVSDAIYSDGSFRVPQGTLAFSPGSSGWNAAKDGKPIRWMELFLRGGNAWERFGRPRVNQVVTRL